MSKKLSQEEWVEKAYKMHGDKYGYSKSIYKGNKIPVDIYCKIHKKYFTQTPKNHMRGQGCPDCGRESSIQAVRYTQEKFFKKCIKIHGDKYDYSTSIYLGSEQEVEIFCKKHNLYFTQKASAHLRGHGCPTCSKNKKSNNNEFITKSMQIHANIYNYCLVNYINNKTKVKIICNKHGIFAISPDHHLRGNGGKGRGCPTCSKENISNRITGKTNPNYKHGRTKYCSNERNTPENYQWMKAIKKDKICCDCCDVVFLKK